MRDKNSPDNYQAKHINAIVFCRKSGVKMMTATRLKRVFIEVYKNSTEYEVGRLPVKSDTPAAETPSLKRPILK
jgi:hypothetical protein